jgi:hypothetical protein
MSGILRFSEANPIRMVITSWIGRNANDRQYQMFRDFSKPNFDSFFQPFLQTDSLTVQFDSSFDTTNTIRLKNYYTDVVVLTASATEQIDNTTYSVYEHTFSLAGQSGLFYVEAIGTDADTETYTAVSEPISIESSQCNTVLFAYYNNEVAFGIDYRSGVTFYFRVPAFFNRTADEDDVKPFTDSGGNDSIVSAEIIRQRVLKASKLLPQWMIEKVNIALKHDSCLINSVAVSSRNSWAYDLISDRSLWGEPDAVIRLASGSNNFRNVHDSGSRDAY